MATKVDLIYDTGIPAQLLKSVPSMQDLATKNNYWDLTVKTIYVPKKLAIVKKLVISQFTIKIIYTMARISNTLIGKSSGSVGNATFSTWKGINVLKEKPFSVANPKTDKQLMRRSALTQVVEIFRLIPSAIDAGFKKLAVKKSAYNAFASDALKNAFDYSTPPDATIDLSLLKVSKGTIASTAIDSITADRSANTVSIEYNTTVTGAGQSLTDVAIVAAFNSDTSEWISANGNDLRSDGVATVTMPASWLSGHNITAYLGFYNPTSAESSDSVNTDTTIVA